MKDAITKAIEGGYKITARHRHGDGFPSDSVNEDVLLLDPLFWQCLGKALGWSGKVDMKFINAFGNTLVIEQIQRWEMHQHKFIHHLADGKDADDFFNNLQVIQEK